VKKIAIILLVVSLIGGCASVFNPPYQDVNVITGNPNSKVYIDTVFAGKGDTIVVHMYKDCTMRQVKIETDSCKTDYKAIFPVKKSPWYIVSCILVVPSLYDFSSKSWDYDDNFNTGKPRRHEYWAPGMKYMYVDDISFEIKQDNNTLKLYWFDNYINGDKPYDTEKLDSMKVRQTNFDENFTEMLKKNNFVDTTDNVFVDNKNTIVLNCNVEKTVFDGVAKYYNAGGFIIDNSFFLVAEIDAKWSAMNTYGDTLFSKTITSRSGSFVIDKNSNSNAYTDIIWDALENTWLDLMDTKEMKELCKIGSDKKEILESMAVSKPVKSPGSIDDAMKASFTIKSDNGHGSGFLVSNDGYIITNYHVINNVKNLKAIDNEGKEFAVKVVRYSKDYDLALLKIEGNFEFAFTIPAEKNFKTGQDAYAIGTPKSVQLGQSLSKGIVSGYRSHSGLNYIQTDISINKGNSGGAVISPAGDLLGVVEYKMFGIGTEGISFSIPAFEVLKALALNYQ